mmetsp:Transcript_821/g.3209  ORF Transcript_821/g.3209 Transcript_821/m.3209 type:complete len:271 (-) Transcript_821:400-1212(-)
MLRRRGEVLWRACLLRWRLIHRCLLRRLSRRRGLVLALPRPVLAAWHPRGLHVRDELLRVYRQRGGRYRLDERGRGHHVGIKVGRLSVQPGRQPVPHDEGQVGLQLWGRREDQDVDQDGQEVVRTGTLPRGHRQQVADDPAAVQDADELVPRGLVRVDLAQLLLCESPALLVPILFWYVQVLRFQEALEGFHPPVQQLVPLLVLRRDREASAVELGQQILLQALARGLELLVGRVRPQRVVLEGLLTPGQKNPGPCCCLPPGPTTTTTKP